MDCDREYVPCSIDSDCLSLCTSKYRTICGDYGANTKPCVRYQHFDEYRKKLLDRNLRAIANEELLMMFVMNRNVGYLEPRLIPMT